MIGLKTLVKPWGISARVPDLDIHDLVLDSRQVSYGRVFVAIKGHAVDGRDYIKNAIAQGAAAVLQQGNSLDVIFHNETPVITLPGLEDNLSELAGIFYETHERSLMLVGVTGTNGKTSITHYVAEINRSLGRDAAVIGTLGYGKPDNMLPLINTTPDPLSVHRLIDHMAEQGARHIAMEVSSHGIEQGRVATVPYKVAVFSNLSRDHLDYHGTMQAYGDAKAKLFQWQSLQGIVINADDTFGQKLLGSGTQGGIRIGYSLQDTVSLPEDCEALTMNNIEAEADGFRANICFRGVSAEASIPLLGEFNLSNVLAAVGVLLVDGVSLSDIAPRLAELKPVAGRMECFKQQGFATVVVDYAHTPDALEQVLKAARKHCNGQLVALFGCGGDRDKGKRPLMAKVAEKLADSVVVTADNPRTESMDAINADIMAGFEQLERVNLITDRHLAIQQVLGQYGEGDLVVIAGKGHEDYQLIGEQKLHFSDREVVAELMEAMA